MIKKFITSLSIAVCMMSSVNSYAADSTFLTLDYTDSKELITSSDDLFSNISSFMPGDVYSDTLSVSNKNKNTIELFFKSIPLDSTLYELNEDYDLLKEINLDIDFNGNKVYTGSLIGSELSDIISLGKMKSDESGDFNFTISVPSELTNDFNMTKTKVKWYFAVTEDKIPLKPPQKNPTPPVTTTPPSKSPNVVKKPVDTTPSPHTGGSMIAKTVGSGALLLVGSGIVALGSLKKRKGDKNENKK